MGKHRHSKDRLYVKNSELRGAQPRAAPPGLCRKPAFDLCALTLRPWEDPVATPAGDIFDLVSITDFVNAHGRNPLTQEPLALGQLLRLRFRRAADGACVCPLSGKRFTESTKLCVVRTSGNVYAADTLEAANLRPGLLTNLVSGEAFTAADVITLQDPNRYAEPVPAPALAKRPSPPPKTALSVQSVEALRAAEKSCTKPAFSFYKRHKGDAPTRLCAEDLKAQLPLARFWEEREQLKDWRVPGEETGLGAAVTCSDWSGSRGARCLSRFEMLKELSRRARAAGKKSCVDLHTDRGMMRVELWSDETPGCVASFIQFLREAQFPARMVCATGQCVLRWQGACGGAFAWMDKAVARQHRCTGLLTVDYTGRLDSIGLALAPPPHHNSEGNAFGQVEADCSVLSALMADVLCRGSAELRITGAEVTFDALQQVIDEVRRELLPPPAAGKAKS